MSKPGDTVTLQIEAVVTRGERGEAVVEHATVKSAGPFDRDPNRWLATAEAVIKRCSAGLAEFAPPPPPPSGGGGHTFVAGPGFSGASFSGGMAFGPGGGVPGETIATGGNGGRGEIVDHGSLRMTMGDLVGQNSLQGRIRILAHAMPPLLDEIERALQRAANDASSLEASHAALVINVNDLHRENAALAARLAEAEARVPKTRPS